MDTCFVKSWTTSGSGDDRPTEDVTFFFNRIGAIYRQATEGKEWGKKQPIMTWDNVANTKDWYGKSCTMDFKPPT